MKVSIVIPVYNTSVEYLTQCFESIQNQTEKDFEAVIIDDGSDSDTAEYLDAYAVKDNRFCVFHKKTREYLLPAIWEYRKPKEST